MLFTKIKSAFVQTAQRLTRRDLAVKLHHRLRKGKNYHFHGGLHLELGKQLTNQAPLYSLGSMQYYLLNMQQHKGPRPISLVQEGQEVKAGQLLTSNYIPGELPIHSPIDGTVIAIQDYLYASELTKSCPTIVIANNNTQESTSQLISLDYFRTGTPIGPKSFTPLNYLRTPRLDLLWRIKNAGIAGMGGAVFPSARKINNREFKSLIINAAECEPYITCDDALMQHYSEQLVQATICVQHLLQAENVIIAIEDDKPKSIKKLQESITSHKANYRQLLQNVNFDFTHLAAIAANLDKAQFTAIYSSNTLELAAKLYALEQLQLRVIPTRYPSGNQRTTIEVLTGLRLTKKQNLTSMGAICFNIMTVYAMYRAIAYGEALTQRLVTITGKGIAKPSNYWLPFGCTPAYLLEVLGASCEFTGQVIMGGPMMGVTLDDLNTPINKATNCLIFVGKSEVEAEPKLFAQLEEQACIRCTACQEVCPMLLQPQQLYWYEKDKDDKKLIRANLSSCVECGLCDYVCPSNIPLVSYFQSAKYRIYTERQKAQAADESKARYEVKSAREAIAKAERDAKRAADKARNEERAKAMREKIAQESGIDPVKAAMERLRAKGVATAQTTKVTSQNDLPNNSDIMEQRRLRRLAKEQAQATSSSTDKQSTDQISKTTISKLDHAAVLAAVARAKAAQAQAKAQSQDATEVSHKFQENNTVNLETDNTNSNSATKPLDKAAVLDAVARAKAKAKGDEVTPPQQSVSSTEKKSAIAAAVAKAKAAQAAAQAAAKTDTQATTSATVQANEVASSTQADSKKAAITAAIAKAKAAQAIAKTASQATTSETAQANEVESSTQANSKKAAITAAVAKAKAAQAIAKTASQATTSETAQVNEVESSTQADSKKAAITAAVAKAKASQAKIQTAQTVSEQNSTVSSLSQDKKAAALAAVARAKAKIAKQQNNTAGDSNE